MPIAIKGKISILHPMSYTFSQSCEEVSYSIEFKIEVGWKQISQNYKPKLIKRSKIIKIRRKGEKRIKVRSKVLIGKMVSSIKKC